MLTDIGSFPSVRVIVTGKGPLKAEYERIFAEKNKEWNNCKVNTAWLEADDYPSFVGSCDLGVCFHTSSSGLDLPMKVVDMFAASLPAFAIEYPAIWELVIDQGENQNGRIFTDEFDLSEMIFEVLKEGGHESESLARYWRNLDEGFSQERWETHWNLLMKEIIF